MSAFEDIDKTINEDMFEIKGFKYSGKAVLLTYKTHIIKEELLKFFLTITTKVKTVRICHETSTKVIPYLHTHALITFSIEYQTTSCRRFDFNGIHPNVRKVWLTKHAWHLKNTIAYLGKDDKEGSNLLYGEDNFESSVVERVFACDTLQEALLNEVDKPSDAIGIKTLFECKPSAPICILPTLYPWQDALYKELKQTPHPRKIIWICDVEGGSGKTDFCLHLMSLSKDYYAVNQTGGAYHFATVIGTALSSGWTGHCIFFNLQRAAETHAIYEPLEMVKDGFITELKFRGKTNIFPKPWVVVFANWFPRFDRTLSRGRWDIRVPCLPAGTTRPVKHLGESDFDYESRVGREINIKIFLSPITADECAANNNGKAELKNPFL